MLILFLNNVKLFQDSTYNRWKQTVTFIILTIQTSIVFREHKCPTGLTKNYAWSVNFRENWCLPLQTLKFDPLVFHFTVTLKIKAKDTKTLSSHTPMLYQFKFEARHEISNNVVCKTSKGSSACAYAQSDQSLC